MINDFEKVERKQGCLKSRLYFIPRASHVLTVVLVVFAFYFRIADVSSSMCSFIEADTTYFFIQLQSSQILK